MRNHQYDVSNKKYDMNNKELVELCKNGNEQALGLLYTTYADKMLKICSYYVTDKQAAQDILHDGFLIIISSIHSLRSPEKLESWMGKIMRNLSLRYLEQQNTTGTVSLDVISDREEPTDYENTDELPSYSTIVQLIEKLPEGYRKIFKLSVLEGLSHKEISSLLQIAPHSSSSQLSRAKKMLSRLLTQYRMIVFVALLSALSVYYIFRVEKDKSVPKVQAKSERGSDASKDSPLHIDSLILDNSAITQSRQVHRNPENVGDTFKEDTLNACQDSIIERKEKYFNSDETEEKYSRDSVININNHIPGYLTIEKNKNWILSLSYSGATNLTDYQKINIPGSIASGESKEIIEKSHHLIPIVFSLSAQKQIDARWGIETGIQYSLLRSEFTSSSVTHVERKQMIHYIGIPLKGNFNIWKSEKFSIYTSAGLTLDVPIKAFVTKSLLENGQIIMQEKDDLNPSLQWSTSIGLGLQYQITPTIGIYVEPNMNYYFNSGDGIKTIRTEKPLNVTLPIGIRLSW